MLFVCSHVVLRMVCSVVKCHTAGFLSLVLDLQRLSSMITHDSCVFTRGFSLLFIPYSQRLSLRLTHDFALARSRSGSCS